MRIIFILLAFIMLFCPGCRQGNTGKQVKAYGSTYPVAIDPLKVGKYPALCKSGGGYFYDDVLEYRVWIHPESGDDYYRAFKSYEDANQLSKATKGAEPPLVLIRQREWIDEPTPGHFIRKSGERITEWQVDWLAGTKRELDSIEKFMSKVK